MSAAETKAVFLSYASPSFAGPTEGRHDARSAKANLFTGGNRGNGAGRSRLSDSLRSLRFLLFNSEA